MSRIHWQDRIVIDPDLHHGRIGYYPLRAAAMREYSDPVAFVKTAMEQSGADTLAFGQHFFRAQDMPSFAAPARQRYFLRVPLLLVIKYPEDIYEIHVYETGIPDVRIRRTVTNANTSKLITKNTASVATLLRIPPVSCSTKPNTKVPVTVDTLSITS